MKLPPFFENTIAPKTILLRLSGDQSFVSTVRYAGLFQRSTKWFSPESIDPAGQTSVIDDFSTSPED